MQIDLEEFSGQLSSTEYCIVGGGIAGLILARRVAERGHSVTLLEAGGFNLEERSQSLYAAEMPGERHTGTDQGRFRTFGGSSTRWGGQLLPYTPDVFHPPDGSPSEGWPIGEDEICGYYDEIQALLGAGRRPFGSELLIEMGLPALDLGPELQLRFSKWLPFRRRNLAQTIGQECLQHPLVQVITHANVTELLGNGSEVSSARVVDYKGREFKVAAELFLVCCGTVESSRLLLNSKSVPNQNDEMGRYFHDHVSLHAAVVPASARAEVFRRLGPFFMDGVLHTCKLEATAELRGEHSLLATMGHIVIQEPEDSGIAALRNLLVSVQRGRLKEALLRDFLPMVRGARDVVHLVWAAKVRKRRPASERSQVWLNIDLEQRAAAENRIRLSADRDAIGMPKAIVEWKVGDAERDTASRFAGILRERLLKAAFPPLDWRPGLFDGEPFELADTYHAMGGLRMGTDPRHSVVNCDLRVHGVSNLYVASCAVFPAGGSSNPTFTLMALALRLADHLEGRSCESARHAAAPAHGR